jgi:hypothetical protein
MARSALDQGNSPTQQATDQLKLSVPKHGIEKRSDMSWHDYLVELLRVGASLEHALMVQYLYAAYSLGGPQVPEKYRPMVRRWQEAFLLVAKEEMGHLLTVQNMLTFLGAAPCFTRGEFPWEIEYFSLEPLTRPSLACYVFAEMPDGRKFKEEAEVRKLVSQHLAKHGHARDKGELLIPVGDIYAEIIGLFEDTERIPDCALKPETYSSQASWDDWGRGYKPEPLPLDPEGNLIPSTPPPGAQSRPVVQIAAVATRTQAIAALKALSIQGEGPYYGVKKKPGDEEAHFDRFLEIYREMSKYEKASWRSSLPVPVNPSTVKIGDGQEGYIVSAHSRDWGHLFNLRYRILLTSLAHTFRLARKTRSDEPSVRAVMMHRVFGEMYNLKTIAGILVNMPLDEPDDPRRAGPPFELPADHSLPPADVDCWCLHLDTLQHASALCRQMLKAETAPHSRAYLETLIDLDTQTKTKIERILTGLGSTERYSV